MQYDQVLHQYFQGNGLSSSLMVNDRKKNFQVRFKLGIIFDRVFVVLGLAGKKTVSNVV